jgi:hypothetical protein
MTELAGKRIGVAISGGGHRATLWGLGALLYLVDSGLNRAVATISSVSGGSIANAAVGLHVDFRRTEPKAFREAMQPTVSQITTDGLFFFGSATNPYVYSLLALAGLAVVAVVLVLGVMTTQVVRLILDSAGACSCRPAFAMPWWIVGVIGLVVFASLAVLSCLYAKRCLWGLILVAGALVAGGMVPLVATALGASWNVQMGSGFPALTVILLLLLLIGLPWFGRRSTVAQKAMDKVHFQEAKLDALNWGPCEESTCHVLCATELQSGLHAYFAGSFLYNNQVGVSTETRQIPLAFAVQSSAALPGAFGPRRLATAPLSFIPPRGEAVEVDCDGQVLKGEAAEPEPPLDLVLLDGGIYDNMADQWLLGLEARREKWLSDFGRSYADMLPRVDQYLVVNSSPGWKWRFMSKLPNWCARLLNEAAPLARAQSIMYNTVGRQRREHLGTLWWLAHRGEGTFVETNDNPFEAAEKAAEKCPQVLDLVRRLGKTDQDWRCLVKRNASYPTVLRRIPAEEARGILWHAYVCTAVATVLYLGGPVPSRLPTLEEFATRDPIGGLLLR